LQLRYVLRHPDIRRVHLAVLALVRQERVGKQV
jgi:hypothetical protein